MKDFSLEVAKGEFVVLVGPSGCGKSTLLLFVAGLLHPSEGEILVQGKPVDGPSPQRIMVFQQPALFPWLDVRGNVAFGLKRAGVPAPERRRRVEEMLKLVELESFGHSRIHELSGGMRQRVALARGMVLKPPILLMDEPFAALDAQVRENLQLEVQRLWQHEGTTILFVTHDVREAAVLADRIVIMSHRPGTLKSILPVPLSRPRQAENLEVVDMARQAREALSAEVTWRPEDEWRYV